MSKKIIQPSPKGAVHPEPSRRGGHRAELSKNKWLYDENGKKSGVKISFKDFDKLIDRLEDLHDIYVAYQHTSKKLKTIPYEKVMEKILGKNAKQ